MTTDPRPAVRRPLPTLPDLLTRFVPIPWLRARIEASRPLPIEEYVEDGHYVVRVELPGIDPAKDAELTVADGALVIKAERTEPEHGVRRSEFRYGTFVRAVPLPRHVKENEAHATYADGILSVTVDLAGPEQERRIPVAQRT